ncbi:MAG: acyl--CoA ligase [Proteobacteria bacterium]|nr:acyl--CoA ligase [Pseudomonadota bacterium]
MNPLTFLNLDGESGEPFVLTADDSFTRGTLLRRASAMGADLQKLGVDNERIILSLDSGATFVVGLAACWMAGATPVLLDPLVRREILSAIEMTRARAVICSARGSEKLPDGVCEVIPDKSEAEPYAAPLRKDDEPVLYLFTSGSTGKPTLVPKTFDQLNVEVCFLSKLFSMPRRVATLVPWCHIFGLLTSLLVPARLMGVCDLSAGISPKRVLERAGEGLLDLIVAVPAVYQVMVRYLERGDLLPIPSTCRFTTSGALLNKSLRARFTELTGCKITDLYGSTEAGGVAYRHDNGPWIVEPHVDSRITNEGFLEVRSASVSFGEPDSFYRIGDLVHAEGPGFVLIGRADDVVKIGGRRTALGEIVEAIEAHPGVADAAVLAKKISGALRLVAYVEPLSADFDPQSVKAFVRERLADHKVPRVIRVKERLPRTPAGKVDRQKLASEILEGEQS